MKKLVIGIPNGSLFNPTMEMLEKIGIEIKINERQFAIDLG